MVRRTKVLVELLGSHTAMEGMRKAVTTMQWPVLFAVVSRCWSPRYELHVPRPGFDHNWEFLTCLEKCGILLFQSGLIARLDCGYLRRHKVPEET